MPLQWMDFEEIPLYNKIISGPSTTKEVRKVTNKHVLQKQKNVLERSEAAPIKKYTVRDNIKRAVKN